MIARLVVLALALSAPIWPAVELKDVEFARPAGVSLTLDAWIPESAATQPAVILVHGGGWSAGDKRTYIKPWFPVLSDAGIAWFTINYRLAPQWKHPAAVEDVEAAVAWVRANAAKWNIDPERLALMGESAGGHLVALAGARAKVKVRAVVDFYGANDLPLINIQRGPSKNLENYLPDGTPETVRAASPATYIHRGMPQFLFIHGTGDKAVPWQQSPAMCDAMKAAGAQCEVFLIEGAPHGVSGWEAQPEFQVWKPKVVSWLRAALGTSQGQPSAALGMFEGHADIGSVTRPGSAAYDAGARSYTITGSGENMWGAADAFHFAWKKVSGDVALSAGIAFPKPGGNAHRKAVLMIRQSLDADSAYVDVALHGDGLTSIQYRDARGAATHEVQANVTAPGRLRIEKRGAYFYMLLGAEGQEPALAAGTGRLEFQEPFYAGLGVCSHDKDASETAVFSNVELSPAPPSAAQPVLYSALETISVTSTDRRVVRIFPGRIEAPNWTPDGAELLYNSGGGIYRIPASGGTPALIDTGFATRNNNDHGISPDGKWLAISDQSQEKRQSLIYVVPLAGGTPRRVTALAPSYWHGWSPDGQTLVYCAQRDGEFDVYSIPTAGGEETRLTTAKGLDDGPEFSPDGMYIYFNSDRTGRMQIWRMKPDGSGQEQVTSDDFNNWFAHPSPDGKRLVFLTFEKDVQGHPPNKDVYLRMMNLSDGKITVLARLFGGQGTINTPSWSPDSRRVAFVSHHLFR